MNSWDEIRKVATAFSKRWRNAFEEKSQAVSINGEFHFPCYDHNGNIVRYVSEAGAVAAQYLYDPYGNVVEASGPLADQFSFGFSTKYHDRETGLVAYQQRFYHPPNGRWLNRDPIEEEGGLNLYAFCGNNVLHKIDALGKRCWPISTPTVKSNAEWELQWIRFKTITDSGHTLVYGIFGYWRIAGEVSCACRNILGRTCTKKKDIYKIKEPSSAQDYTSIDPNNSDWFIDVPNLGALPLQIPFFKTISEGFSEIAKNVISDALQDAIVGESSTFLNGVIQDIANAVMRDMPSVDEGFWPKDPCK